MKILLTKLCETFNCQQPDELKKLDEITLVPTTERPDSPVSEDELESDDEVESMQSDIEFELDKTDDKVDDKDQELKKLMAVLKKVEASGEVIENVFVCCIMLLIPHSLSHRHGLVKQRTDLTKKFASSFYPSHQRTKFSP